MYYEIYLDSLFLIQFCMNLYLLELVSFSLHRTATRRRVLLGAFAGAVSSVLTLLIPIPVWMRIILSFLVGTGCMLVCTFRVGSIRGILKIGEKMALFTFLLGGGILLIVKWLPERIVPGIFGVMALGGVMFEIIRGLLEANRKKANLCKVTLAERNAYVRVNAFLDTGNHLIEPISGKPVSVLEKSVFLKLYPDGKANGFRVIPYHSVGKPDGVLPGYLIPELTVEQAGVKKQCRDVYVGISQDTLSAREQYQMILNPGQLL